MKRKEQDGHTALTRQARKESNHDYPNDTSSHVQVTIVKTSGIEG